MKKVIVIEEDGNPKDRFHRLVNNKFFEWLLYMFGYAIVLILVSVLFNKTFYINNSIMVYMLLLLLLLYMY